ncbi:MAG: PD40 domain-containing protein [Burkholderiales bacterium]|nr:PD40 domain-containing protein [Phycisphaerae bacterium]
MGTKSKIVRRLLSGSAFAAVVMSAGCGGDAVTSRPGARDQTPLGASPTNASGGPTSDPFAAPPIDAMTIALPDPQLPAANVFGELPNTVTDPRAGASEFGFQQHSFVDEGYDADPSVSPDGKQILFASTRHSATTDIYMQKVDGLAVTQLTSDAADDAFPTFSPDGQRVAFASNRSGSWDVYLMDRTGKNITQITSGPAHDMHPSFSPDGTRLAYCSLNSRGQWELWIVNLGTNERRQIGYGLFPKWSPDRSKDLVAFQRARNRGGRWFSIWTSEIIDGEARSITEVAVSTNSAVVSPSWSPDGKELAFATIVDPNQIDSRGKPVGQQDIWTVSADGTGRHRLTDGKGINTSPFWSSEGRIFFVSNRSGTDCIWSVAAGGKNFSTAAMPKE